MRHPLSWRSWQFRTVLALVLSVLLARWVWGWYAARTLAGQLAEIRGRGEPTGLADVKIDTLPNAENAWSLQQRATAAIVAGVDSPRASSDEYREYPPYPANWTKRAEASERAHGAVFTLVRQARGLPRAQFRNGFTSPAAVTAFLTVFNRVRHLANTVSDGALYSHVRGDDAEAIERTLDVMHLAASLRQDPTIISQLVGTGIDAMAVNNLQIIAPGLRLDGGGATTRPATRGQIRGVIAQLLDEEATWRGFRASLTSERVFMNDLVHWRATRNWFIRPLAEMEEVRSNRRFDVVVSAADLREHPAVAEALSRVQLDKSASDPFAGIFGRVPDDVVPRYSRWFTMSDGDLSRYFETHFRVIAERRMTAVSLAAQLYRADHGGRWPAQLAELAPAYMPAVPADPFGAGGRLLGYRVIKGVLPGGADRPLVYSEAAGATVEEVWKQAMYGWHQSHSTASPRPRVIRQYRDLARFEPLPPSTKAVEGDPEKPGAPGQ